MPNFRLGNYQNRNQDEGLERHILLPPRVDPDEGRVHALRLYHATLYFHVIKNRGAQPGLPENVNEVRIEK